MALMYPINFPSLDELQELWRNRESEYEKRNGGIEKSDKSGIATIDFLQEQTRIVEMAEAIADLEREMAANMDEDASGPAPSIGAAGSTTVPFRGGVQPNTRGGGKSGGCAGTTTTQQAPGGSSSSQLATSSVGSALRYGRRQIQRVGAAIAADRLNSSGGDRSVVRTQRMELIDAIAAAVYRPVDPASVAADDPSAGAVAPLASAEGEEEEEDDGEEEMSFGVDSPSYFTGFSGDGDGDDGGLNSQQDETIMEDEQEEDQHEE